VARRRQRVIAFVALGVALNASPDGEPVLGPFAVAIYVPVVSALAVGAYVLHRRHPGTPHGAAPARALIDAALAGLVGGPMLLLLVVTVATIRDCATGSGC
jgi:hypothetical protein